MENKKEAAPEVQAQGQAVININELRKENGLEPIPGGDVDLIPTKLLNKSLLE